MIFECRISREFHSFPRRDEQIKFYAIAGRDGKKKKSALRKIYGPLAVAIGKAVIAVVVVVQVGNGCGVLLGVVRRRGKTAPDTHTL